MEPDIPDPLRQAARGQRRLRTIPLPRLERDRLPAGCVPDLQADRCVVTPGEQGPERPVASRGVAGRDGLR